MLELRCDSNQWNGVLRSAADFWRAVDDLIRNGYAERDALEYLLNQPRRDGGAFSYYTNDLNQPQMRAFVPPEWLTRPTAAPEGG